jgi:hypothetical protein
VSAPVEETSDMADDTRSLAAEFLAASDSGDIATE